MADDNRTRIRPRKCPPDEPNHYREIRFIFYELGTLSVVRIRRENGVCKSAFVPSGDRRRGMWTIVLPSGKLYALTRPK